MGTAAVGESQLAMAEYSRDQCCRVHYASVHAFFPKESPPYTKGKAGSFLARLPRGL